MMKKGIDVSKHQGRINWNKVAPHIDFAMLRAGYGKGNIDAFFDMNAVACNNLNIPIGAYWFSYAYTPDMAKREAKFCIDIIKAHNIAYPVCFDFEYDSTKFAQKNGVKVTSNLMCEMAEAFLTEIEKAGYYAMNYTNIDYLNKGFAKLTGRFDTWLAQWNVDEPTKKCGIWQYSDSGKMDGINGNVDMNLSYYDYTKYTKTDYSKIVQQKLGLTDGTISYLKKYKYADELFRKIANGLK